MQKFNLTTLSITLALIACSPLSMANSLHSDLAQIRANTPKIAKPKKSTPIETQTADAATDADTNPDLGMPPEINVNKLAEGFYVAAGPNYTVGTTVSQWGTSANKYQQGMRGWGGQLLLGYDWIALQHFYLGANTFFSFYDASTKGNNVTNVLGSMTLDYNWGIALEPGYAMAPNARVYGRIGMANGYFELRNAVGDNATYSEFGLLIGVGAEIALSNHFSLRNDYTFYNYGKRNNGNPGAIVRPYFVSVGLNLTYHF